MASFLFCWSRGVLAHPRYLRSEAASISTKDGTHSEIFRELSLRRPEPGRTRWLDGGETGRLREYAGDWWVLFGLAISTGLRRGEILALRVSDLNFEVGTVVVQKGKSARARRALPLAGEALTELQRWVNTNRLEPADLLFGSDYRRAQARMGEDPGQRWTRRGAVS